MRLATPSMISGWLEKSLVDRRILTIVGLAPFFGSARSTNKAKLFDHLIRLGCKVGISLCGMKKGIGKNRKLGVRSKIFLFSKTVKDCDNR